MKGAEKRSDFEYMTPDELCNVIITARTRSGTEFALRFPETAEKMKSRLESDIENGFLPNEDGTVNLYQYLAWTIKGGKNQ